MTTGLDRDRLMIEVDNLSKWYGPMRALDQVSFAVQRGRIVGFLGPNGAGKTTCIRILTGFIPATAGGAKVGGFDVLSESHQVRSRIGYLPENTPLYPEMRVEEQLHFFGKLHGLSRPQRRRRIDALSEQVGLGAIRRRPIGQLSKGNRQRVGLAQAMLHDPPVLILDEPTAGLDPAQITEVRKLIAGLADEKTVLLSTHILPEVEKTCQEVIIISGGRIAATGTPTELKSRAREGTRVVVEVRADAEAVRTALSAVSGVASVEVETAEAWSIARVGVAPGASDVRPALGEAIAGRGWVVRSMDHELTSLEEYFVQVTAEERPAA